MRHGIDIAQMFSSFEPRSFKQRGFIESINYIRVKPELVWLDLNDVNRSVSVCVHQGQQNE